MNAYLAVDSGTSSVRAALFGEDMAMIASEVFKRKTDAEMDADAEWGIIKRLIHDLMHKNREYEVNMIAVSQFLAWVPLDRQLRPVANAVLYIDQKEDELESFRRRFDQEVFYKKTGRPATAELAALKLSYLRKHRPSSYENTYCFLSMKDYINYKLTGQIATDYTFACYSMAFNIHTKEWDRDIIEALELDISKFPPLKSCCDVVGYVTEAVSREICLKQGIPVVAGGPDGSVGVVGAGGVEPGMAVSILGTTDVLFAISDREDTETDRNLVKNIHPVNGLWMMGGPMGFSGGTVDWMRNALFGGRSLEEVSELAKRVEPGSEGVLFVTGLTGERTPFWNGDIRGSILGLSTQHSVQHIFRALLEADCFINRNILDRLREHGVQAERLVAVGGGSKNELWMQIKADVLQLPVMIPAEGESTLRGAAALCKIAFEGINALAPILVKKQYEPDALAAEKYQKPYARFIELINILNVFY